MRWDRTRRRVLQTLGAAGLASIAGCTDVLGGSDTTPTEGQDEPTDTSTDTPTSSYELDVQLSESTIDLTDLPARELRSWEDIRDEDFLELEATVYEERGGEREEVEGYELNIQVGNEPVEAEQTDSVYRIACTELETGENDLTITAGVDGETLEQSPTVTKQTPDAHLVEAYVDGDRITGYQSPYEFDTHRLDTGEFYQQRTEQVADSARDNIIENTNEEYLQEVTEDDSISEKERKRRLIGSVGFDSRDLIGNHSAHAAVQAASEEHALHHFTDYDQIYGCGFNNPAEISADGNNHGSKAFYIDGDWYHSETVIAETTHIDNVQGIDMTGGSNSDFVSILAEFEEGEMDELRFSNKMSRMGSFYITQSMQGGQLSGSLLVSDPYGSTGLEMIRDNTAREEIMVAVDVAADHHIETGQRTAVLGTPDDPVILSTNDDNTYNRILEDPDFQGAEIILDAALN